MQSLVVLYTGEQGVAYIPIAKARGITPRVIKIPSANK